MSARGYDHGMRITTYHQAAQAIGMPRPDLLRLSADADADPRTVARRILGYPIGGRVGERIDLALRRAGITPATLAPRREAA